MFVVRRLTAEEVAVAVARRAAVHPACPPKTVRKPESDGADCETGRRYRRLAELTSNESGWCRRVVRPARDYEQPWGRRRGADRRSRSVEMGIGSDVGGTVAWMVSPIERRDQGGRVQGSGRRAAPASHASSTGVRGVASTAGKCVNAWRTSAASSSPRSVWLAAR